jgi:ribosomal protein S18 acetylase RimI-like enzyme
VTIKLAPYDPDQTYPGQKKIDCGNAIINKYVHENLKKQAKQKLCVAYVLIDNADNNKFVGFYTLAQHSISMASLSSLQLGSLPHIISCTRLVMLGVDNAYQGQNLGKRLMREALMMTKNVANQIGSYGMYLNGDKDAIGFYQNLGFALLNGDKSPDPSPMFLSLAKIP